MANPSLQIGNGKWAIKEDNLLGYSKAGTRFVPEPITMTRESAGTRVNPEGLVETVELLGSELVTDGNFPTPNTEWSSFGLATINENVVNFVDAGSNTYSGITQDINSFSAKQYRVEITVTNWISGDILATFSSNNASFNITGNGTYSVYLTPVSNGDDIGLVRDYSSGADFSYSITNVSVKEYTANNLARVDYDGTASSLLVEPERTNLVTYSELFNTGWWVKDVDVTITDNTETSPKGDLTGSLISYDLASRAIYKTSLNLTGEYTFSIYLKGSGDNVGKTIQVDLDNVKYYPTLTSDWVRYDFQTTNLNTLQITNRGTSTISTGEFYAWGASLEVGSYPTSYIPTDGSTVTRVQDQYSKTGISNLIGQTEGTLFVDVDFDTLSGLNMFLSMRPNSSNKIEIYRDGNLIYGEIASSTSFSFIKTGVTVGRYKIAFAYSSGSSAMYINGDLILSNSTSFAFTSTLNDLYVGSRGGTSFIEQAKYNDIKLYKTRLLNSELATLTTI